MPFLSRTLRQRWRRGVLSAAVLAGLLGVSVWTLSSRVKSLDRLK